MEFVKSLVVDAGDEFYLYAFLTDKLFYLCCRLTWLQEVVLPNMCHLNAKSLFRDAGFIFVGVFVPLQCSEIVFLLRLNVIVFVVNLIFCLASLILLILWLLVYCSSHCVILRSVLISWILFLPRGHARVLGKASTELEHLQNRATEKSTGCSWCLKLLWRLIKREYWIKIYDCFAIDAVSNPLVASF